MKTVKIAGVPEHFNLPWHMCTENKEFEKIGVNLEWINVPEGTGKMCQMLRTSDTDIAIILTEGIIRDISLGNPSKIVQVYVESPLLWGIHVDANSKYKAINDLKNKKAAISRLGSGSHLMSYVNAQNQGWNSNELDFEIVHTFAGGVESLKTGNSDYFMWEKFMTKPWVDNGTLRKIATCPTPWPCFVIAVREQFLEENTQILKQILEIINTKTAQFKNIPSITSVLAERFSQKVDDIDAWLDKTEWSQKQMSKEVFGKIQNQLIEVQIIDKKLTFASLFATI
jgi:ABC-type nitrate/sulfonate/bicarbonate transport system substrate-binding protein